MFTWPRPWGTRPSAPWSGGRCPSAGNLAGHQPARGLEIEHEDLRFQQRGVDVAAFAGLLALVSAIMMPSASSVPAITSLTASRPASARDPARR